MQTSRESSLYYNHVMAAPMVRVSSLAFRLLCSHYGADVVFTEELVAAKLTKSVTRFIDQVNSTSSSQQKIPSRFLNVLRALDENNSSFSASLSSKNHDNDDDNDATENNNDNDNNEKEIIAILKSWSTHFPFITECLFSARAEVVYHGHPGEQKKSKPQQQGDEENQNQNQNNDDVAISTTTTAGGGAAAAVTVSSSSSPLSKTPYYKFEQKASIGEVVFTTLASTNTNNTSHHNNNHPYSFPRTEGTSKSILIGQIGASSPEVAVGGASLLAPFVQGIDVNMGCPKAFSTKNGMGSALMENTENAGNIMNALCEEFGSPKSAPLPPFLLPTSTTQQQENQSSSSNHHHQHQQQQPPSPLSPLKISYKTRLFENTQDSLRHLISVYNATGGRLHAMTLHSRHRVQRSETAPLYEQAMELLSLIRDNSINNNHNENKNNTNSTVDNDNDNDDDMQEQQQKQIQHDPANLCFIFNGSVAMRVSPNNDNSTTTVITQKRQQQQQQGGGDGASSSSSSATNTINPQEQEVVEEEKEEEVKNNNTKNKKKDKKDKKGQQDEKNPLYIHQQYINERKEIDALTLSDFSGKDEILNNVKKIGFHGALVARASMYRPSVFLTTNNSQNNSQNSSSSSSSSSPLHLLETSRLQIKQEISLQRQEMLSELTTFDDITDSSSNINNKQQQQQQEEKEKEKEEEKNTPFTKFLLRELQPLIIAYAATGESVRPLKYHFTRLIPEYQSSCFCKGTGGSRIGGNNNSNINNKNDNNENNDDDNIQNNQQAQQKKVVLVAATSSKNNLKNAAQVKKIFDAVQSAKPTLEDFGRSVQFTTSQIDALVWMADWYQWRLENCSFPGSDAVGSGGSGGQPPTRREREE